MSKKTVVMYDSWGNMINALPDEMAGQLVKMILKYAFSEILEESENPAINAMFSMVKQKLDEDRDKYDKKVERMARINANRNENDTKSSRNRHEVGGDNEYVYDNDNVYVNDNVNDNDNKNKRRRFKPPTLQEVQAYCSERDNSVDPETFIDFYESKGWKVGKESMKDWKACVRTWEKRNDRASPKKFDATQYLLDEIAKGGFND